MRFAFAGYRRERDVRSFPAASRSRRREGRVVDRFSSFFSRWFFFILFISTFVLASLFLVVQNQCVKEKEIIVLERRRLATVASRGSLAIRARRIYTTAPNE